MNTMFLDISNIIMTLILIGMIVRLTRQNEELKEQIDLHKKETELLLKALGEVKHSGEISYDTQKDLDLAASKKELLVQEITSC